MAVPNEENTSTSRELLANRPSFNQLRDNEPLYHPNRESANWPIA
jgi:hypothetical protein